MPKNSIISKISSTHQYHYIGVFLCLVFFFCKSVNATNVPLISTVTVTNLDTENCCFQLNYYYDTALGGINALETQILTPNVLFSSVQFPINSGWSFTELSEKRNFLWSHHNGNIPTGEQSLTNFCFSGWNTTEAVEMLFIWRQGNTVRQIDTIRLECTQCWSAQNPIVNCETDSSYTYTFDYVNQSEFNVAYLQIREDSDQDIIIEQNISFSSALLPGETMTAVVIHFRPEAVNVEKVCFEITPHYFLQDTISVQCCTAAYCVPIPVCDRCCADDYQVFEAAVQQGFNIEIVCENTGVRLQANTLNECDQVSFELVGVGAGIVRGNQAVTFLGLSEDQDYEICMSVIRHNINGENCFEEATQEICKPFLIDCITMSVNNPILLDGGHLWPNPTAQKLNIQLPIQAEQNFEVWNSTGQCIFQSQTNYQGQSTIATSQWPDGFYYITAYIKAKVLWRKAFIINH